MPEHPTPHSGLRRILRETFPSLNLLDSTCLVGVLFDCQILLLDATWVLPALEPEEAASLIAELYDHNSHQLLQRFRNNWSMLKRSTNTSRVFEELQRHEFIESIIPFEEWDSQEET